MALALVPEAVAFAFIAGLSPLTGLYAAFMMGLITSIFGGRPGMISGTTGAVAVVIVALAKSHGVEYVFATVVLAGVIQIAAGLLRLGKLMRWARQQGSRGAGRGQHSVGRIFGYGRLYHDWAEPYQNFHVILIDQPLQIFHRQVDFQFIN